MSACTPAPPPESEPARMRTRPWLLNCMRSSSSGERTGRGALIMDERDGALLKQGDNWEIRFERRLRHPPQTVWDTITAPGAMSRWFDETVMPDPLTVGATIRFIHNAVN